MLRREVVMTKVHDEFLKALGRVVVNFAAIEYAGMSEGSLGFEGGASGP